MNVAVTWGRTIHQASASRAPGPSAPVAAVRAQPTDGERRITFAIGAGALMVVAVALLLVWVRLQAVHTGYQLSAARHLAHRLEQEQRELELEIATLTSPRRLETLARERLGMGPPAAGQIVSVP
jgi:cell division protein FtsL